MKEIAQLSGPQRRDLFEQASSATGLRWFLIEKDFWVYWVLGVLFKTPTLRDYLTFRGGTSLSKGWQLIQRFSEDVDLAIDRSWLLDEDEDPAEADTKAQRTQRLKRLRAACREVITEHIEPALQRAGAEIAGTPRIEIENLERARDPFVVHWFYPTATSVSQGDYHTAAVKIDLSGRADDWPSEKRPITAYVHDVMPDHKQSHQIACVEPVRTFLEKAALIHEQHTRPEPGPIALRQSRHLYDLAQLWLHVREEKRLAKLFEDVKAHRKVFFEYTWVDYD